MNNKSFNYNIFNDIENSVDKIAYCNSIIESEVEHNTEKTTIKTTQTLDKTEIMDGSYDFFYTKDLRLLRNALNKLDLSNLSQQQLINELLIIEDNFSDFNVIENLKIQLMQMTHKESVVTIDNLRGLLNNTDLINHETITSDEFINNKYPNINKK